MNGTLQKIKNKLDRNEGVLVDVDADVEAPVVLDRKAPVNVDFGGRDIKLDKDFSCPICDAKVKVTNEMVANKGSNVYRTAAVISDRNQIIAQYNRNPKSFADYFEFAAPLAKCEQLLNEIGDPTTSIATSIQLSCGHNVDVRIECNEQMLSQPKKSEVLQKLGLDSEHAWRWLSYIFTADGHIDQKLGQKKAEGIINVVESYHKEKSEFEAFAKEFEAKLPKSVTDLDGRIKENMKRDIREVLDELEAIISSVVHDIDQTLSRVSLRPENMKPRKGGYVVGPVEVR